MYGALAQHFVQCHFQLQTPSGRSGLLASPEIYPGLWYLKVRRRGPRNAIGLCISTSHKNWKSCILKFQRFQSLANTGSTIPFVVATINLCRFWTNFQDHILQEEDLDPYSSKGSPPVSLSHQRPFIIHSITVVFRVIL